MRTIRRTTAIKRDYKRENKGRHRHSLADDLLKVLTMLMSDEPLPRRHHDHPLVGEWKDHRDCHIKHDLVLIYRKPDDRTLDVVRSARASPRLVRLGSHSELGL